MEPISKTTSIASTQHTATQEISSLKLDVSSADKGDAAQFRAALERYLQSAQGGIQGVQGAQVKGKESLGEKIMDRCTAMAGEVKEDQQHVSRLLEQATRTGDSMQMMKAMMALSDYQTRVQFVAKTVSKATSSLDQLTRLQ